MQAKMLVEEIEDVHVEDAEIKFGINTVGEIGNIAIGRFGRGELRGYFEVEEAKR